MSAWSAFEKHHQEMVNERQREETTWRDLARFCRPDNVSMNTKDMRERDGSDDPFDSTGLYALDDFVGGLFVKANNPAERWFGFALPPEFKELQEYRPVKAYLTDYANTVYTSLNPARDNFYLSVPAWFADSGCFGTGFIYDEEHAAGGFVCRPIPIGAAYKDTDAAGEITCFHHRFALTGRQAKIEYGDRAPANQRDDERADFVQVFERNDAYVPGALGARGKRWKSCVVSPDKRDFYFDRPGGGYHELPVHQIEWNFRSGRKWATGPGHNALADLRGNDEMTRSAITSAQFDSEPMIAVNNEDVMTSADISPGSVLYGALNEQGKRLAEYMERKTSPQSTLLERQNIRNAIMRAFRFSLAQVLASRPQMTAEEVLSWKAEDLKMLAPNLIRLQRGFGSFITRRANMLARAGRAPAPPPELARYGASIELQFSNPFEKAQQAETASGVLRWVNTKTALAEQTQDPSWTDDIDKDGVSSVLHRAYTDLPEVRLDPREVAQIRQQRAATQAAMAGAEQDALDAETTAKLAHADQARTRAAERQGVRR